MPTNVLEHTRTLAVLPRVWLFEDAGAEIAGTTEGRVDVRHPHLDEVCDDAGRGRHLIVVHVGGDDGTVGSNTQLSAVCVADPHPFLEAEGGLEPDNCRSHIRIDQYRRNGRRWCRAIRQHGR